MRAATVLLAACALLLFSVSSASAQEVVIPYVEAEEQQDALELDIFFYLRNAQGRPLINANFSSASVQLLGSNNEPVTAAISQPQTPLNVALLIDISGSMVDTIGDVRNAAKSAISSAPSDARFAIIQFNRENRVVQSLTDEPFRIRSAIDDIGQPEGATCLYDSIYDAINMLNRNQGSGLLERKAVVVFTDGHDQLKIGSTEPCSTHTYNDVINLARQTETPVHTIGLSSGVGDSIDENELRGLADNTDAFSVIGQRADVRGLFNSIFGGLNSQYVARARVLAKRGKNQGVLQVNLSGGASLLPGTFEFNSNRDYLAPTPIPAAPTPTPVPLVRILINDLLPPQVDKNYYELSLNIDNPQVIDQILFAVESKDGVTIPSAKKAINLNGRAQLTAKIVPDVLEDGGEYIIKIKAIDKQGFLIEPPPKDYEDELPGPILAEHGFTHHEIEEPPPQVEIESVVVDHLNNRLIIDLGFEERVIIDRYEGFIINVETGQKIYDIQRKLFSPGAEQIILGLPETIQKLETERKFRLSLTLLTETGKDVTVNEYEFTAIPLKPTTMWEKIKGSLQNDRTIWLFALLIVFGVFGWALFSRRDRKQPFTLQRSIRDDTVVGGIGVTSSKGGPSNHPQIHVRVTQTNSPADRGDRVISDFPCIIGRSSKAHVKFVGDKQISGRHAQITRRDDQFYLTDLGSANGTFVDNVRLAPKEERRLRDVQTVRLGRQTSMELRIQYP